eukprot:7234542-Prymnesium_polylepis.1
MPPLGKPGKPGGAAISLLLLLSAFAGSRSSASYRPGSDVRLCRRCASRTSLPAASGRSHLVRLRASTWIGVE